MKQLNFHSSRSLRFELHNAVSLPGAQLINQLLAYYSLDYFLEFVKTDLTNRPNVMSIIP